MGLACHSRHWIDMHRMVLFQTLILVWHERQMSMKIIVIKLPRFLGNLIRKIIGR
ncbi:MAG TPA: stage V sporulation protein SpoVM [Clostridiaceae bacterium]|nr:stage V sporulation protein SpoVM [Clostridiaceae bacterium]